MFCCLVLHLSSQEECSQTCMQGSTASSVGCWKQGPTQKGKLAVLSLLQRIWDKGRGGEGLSRRKAAEVINQNKHHKQVVLWFPTEYICPQIIAAISLWEGSRRIYSSGFRIRFLKGRKEWGETQTTVAVSDADLIYICGDWIAVISLGSSFWDNNFQREA